MKLPKYLTAVSLLALLALAGCGGGGGETETAVRETTEERPSLTKAELISQGDAICAEVNAAVASVGTSAADSSTQAEQVADLYTNMVDNLLRLGTPEDNAGYTDFIQAGEQLAKVQGEAKLAAEREDSEALSDASSRVTVALEEFESQAAIYGFEECSQGPSIPAPAPESGGEGEEGGVEVAPEVEEEAVPEEIVPEEEAAPETGGAGGGVEEAAPEGGGTESGGGSESGGVGPG